MNLELKDKKIFISGSTKGIGLAIAEGFLQEGALVILNGHDQFRLNHELERLNKLYPGKVHSALGNLTTEQGGIQVKDEVEKIFGSLDVFIANLGNGKPKNKNPLEIEEWQRFYDINVLGNVRLLNGLYPLLKRGKLPNVVFISSIAAREKSSAPYGYAAAKGALLTLTRYLSKDWACDGIRVNSVLPGNIYFEGGRWEELRNADMEEVERYISSNVPMKRFGTPREISDAVLFLASGRAGFITGAALAIDGGQMSII